MIPANFFLETSCRECLYWIKEGTRDGTSQEATKKRWLTEVDKSFGECAKAVYLSDELAAWAMFAPPRFLPTISNYPVKPSDDAIFIACLTVSPSHRRKGIGSAMLNEVVTSLRARGFRMVETIARKDSANNPSGPIEFYTKNGFRVWRDNNEFPILRLRLLP
jgi:ribosomal protein S18 acetylase RimI-like enzyme